MSRKNIFHASIVEMYVWTEDKEQNIRPGLGLSFFLTLFQRKRKNMENLLSFFSLSRIKMQKIYSLWMYLNRNLHTFI